VSEAADAIDDEMLVDAALDLFAGVDDDAGGAGNASEASTTALKTVKTGVSGVVKGPTNHLVRLGSKRKVGNSVPALAQ